ncbi:MAG TPA: PhnD/SsuA/transferrin family substrate-binding protein [Acidimicrobiia bacterium]|jgi:ABC-type phosphate/phosphonate transport system substrate-binding protein|nr:PhnD/SsuA/transferrin family substrate-binding protein [Acidimicrobiia bacterium]
MGGPGTLLMGAVAYDPKVVTIWDGFRRWFAERDFDFDYVLYSNYERQVDDLLAGRIHAAWNSPLAWVRARRLGEAQGVGVSALTMRDTDQDLTTVVVVRAESPITELDGLRGRLVGTGAIDSPQATLLPVHHLQRLGLTPGTDVDVRRFDVGVGLHGDHIGGERDAAAALAAGELDAACMSDGNHLLFTREGTLASGATRVLSQTVPYDHCNMTVTDAGPQGALARFGELLLAMDYGDPEVRPLLDLEGLKQWKPGRTSGYAALEAAVDDLGFYDGKGAITAGPDYRP